MQIIAWLGYSCNYIFTGGINHHGKGQEREGTAERHYLPTQEGAVYGPIHV